MACTAISIFPAAFIFIGAWDFSLLRLVQQFQYFRRPLFSLEPETSPYYGLYSNFNISGGLYFNWSLTLLLTTACTAISIFPAAFIFIGAWDFSLLRLVQQFQYFRRPLFSLEPETSPYYGLYSNFNISGGLYFHWSLTLLLTTACTAISIFPAAFIFIGAWDFSLLRLVQQFQYFRRPLFSLEPETSPYYGLYSNFNISGGLYFHWSLTLLLTTACTAISIFPAAFIFIGAWHFSLLSISALITKGSSM